MRIGLLSTFIACAAAACASLPDPPVRKGAVAPATPSALRTASVKPARAARSDGGQPRRPRAKRSDDQVAPIRRGPYVAPVSSAFPEAVPLQRQGYSTIALDLPEALPVRSGPARAQPAAASPLSVWLIAALGAIAAWLFAVALWRMWRRPAVRSGERVEPAPPVASAPVESLALVAEEPNAVIEPSLGEQNDAIARAAYNEAFERPQQAETENEMSPVDAEQHDAGLREALAIARHRLSANDPERALQALAPYAQLDDAPPAVLMTLAKTWMQLGEATGDADCFGTAADALLRVKASGEQRDIPDVSHGIGCCRLEQAQRLSGAAQRQALDRAVEHLGAAASSRANPRLLMDQGAALLLRAKLTQGDRVGDLEAAEAAFRGALLAGASLDSGSAWCLQLTLRQLADAQPASDAVLRREQAREIIVSALEKCGDSSREAIWRASSIQLSVDEVLASRWEGAVKRIRLKEIQATHRSLLVPGAAPPIVFTWVKLLCEQAKELIGRARREKFGEAERALDLVDTPANSRDEMEMRLLAAQIARQRGYGEDAATRLLLLSEAERSLESYLRRPGATALQMEAALVALDRAGLLRPSAAAIAAKKAIALCEPLQALCELEADALRCHLKASLLLDDNDLRAQAPADRSRVDRLIELAPEDAQTWVLAARYALAGGQYRQASDHCRAASRLGASETVLRPLRVRIDAAWQTTDVLPAVAIQARHTRASAPTSVASALEIASGQ
ncbi:hypothetical protein [Pseudomonas sp. CGJS7]|uniref:hypothetical protein n=1 Tax=Pseudomonas sp. CGJS7 TaxID=3109348 RepID=UPI00300A6787